MDRYALHMERAQILIIAPVQQTGASLDKRIAPHQFALVLSQQIPQFARAMERAHFPTRATVSPTVEGINANIRIAIQSSPPILKCALLMEPARILTRVSVMHRTEVLTALFFLAMVFCRLIQRCVQRTEPVSHWMYAIARVRTRETFANTHCAME